MVDNIHRNQEIRGNDEPHALIGYFPLFPNRALFCKRRCFLVLQKYYLWKRKERKEKKKKFNVAPTVEAQATFGKVIWLEGQLWNWQSTPQEQSI